MNFAWHDVTGMLGVTLIIGTYLLLQLGRIASSSLSYSVINALGAGLVIVSLAWDFNLSALIVEIFWVLISLLGIGRALQRRSGGDKPAPS